jgi:hypothetical protein
MSAQSGESNDRLATREPVPPEHEITRLLHEARRGDRAAFDQVLPLMYAELRGIAARHMRRERESHIDHGLRYRCAMT